MQRDGHVRVVTGGASLGQGLETVLAQIAADELALTIGDVSVVQGDTNALADGMGSWASRSTVVGGSAVKLAAEGVVDDARRMAAGLLGMAEEELTLERPCTLVAPDGRRLTLAEITRRVSEVMPGEAKVLSGRATFTVDHMTYPYGVHLAQVEVDPDTGQVSVRRSVVYEIGRAVNPQLVHGQLVGGAAQGLGGALMEEFRYTEDGQPLATTFMDYLLPTAQEVAPVQTLLLEDAPSPNNPLGVKGAGEGGTTAAGAVLAAAIGAALGIPGDIRVLPATPERVREIVRNLGRAGA